MDIAFHGNRLEEARPACLAGRRCRCRGAPVSPCERSVTQLAWQPARRRYAGGNSTDVAPAKVVHRPRPVL